MKLPTAFDRWLRQHPEASCRQAWEASRREALLDADSACAAELEDHSVEPSPHRSITVKGIRKQIASIMPTVDERKEN